MERPLGVCIASCSPGLFTQQTNSDFYTAFARCDNDPLTYKVDVFVNTHGTVTVEIKLLSGSTFKGMDTTGRQFMEGLLRAKVQEPNFLDTLKDAFFRMYSGLKLAALIRQTSPPSDLVERRVYFASTDEAVIPELGLREAFCDQVGAVFVRNDTEMTLRNIKRAVSFEACPLTKTTDADDLCLASSLTRPTGRAG